MIKSLLERIIVNSNSISSLNSRLLKERINYTIKLSQVLHRANLSDSGRNKRGSPSKSSSSNSSRQQSSSVDKFIRLETPKGPYLSNMDSPMEIIDDELRDRALNICREYLGGAWHNITPDEMSFTPIR